MLYSSPLAEYIQLRRFQEENKNKSNRLRHAPICSGSRGYENTEPFRRNTQKWIYDASSLISGADFPVDR